MKKAEISYAIGGSNATSVWIASVDISAVRHARNVELVLNRRDLPSAERALNAASFVMPQSGNQIRFLDGLGSRWRDGVEITFAGQPVRGEFTRFVAPRPDNSDTKNGVRVLRLDSLVEFQLARFRLHDAVDLSDMIDVGLVDRSLTGALASELAARLVEFLEDPDG